MGDVVLAANAVMMNLLMFMAFPLDGFAHAAEALVGRAVGARDRVALDGTVRASTLWALIMAVAFAAVYLVAGTLVIDVLTNVEAVRASAREVLPWLIVAPLISVWSYLLDGIFIGATRSTEMRNAMIVSLVAYLAATWTLTPIWGNHGLWLAFLIFMAVRGATLAYYYPRIPLACDAPPGALAR
jgi:MATE family multidrug resistance protein